MTQQQCMRLLNDFLNDVKSVKNSSFTHTSITSPAGSYYIQADEMDKFIKLYANAYKTGNSLYFTEKHRDISPVLLDFDFRFKLEDTTRKYTDKHIESIITIYVKELVKFVDCDLDQMEIYVMEKSAPVVFEEKCVVKDGIHIMIPSVVTVPAVQILIRENVLKQLEHALSDMKCTNTIEDIYDEAVIHRNNWQMYGSKKPLCEAYKITKIFKINDEYELTTNEIELDHSGYVNTLSIRNKFVESTYKTDMSDTILEKHKEILKKDNKQKKKKEIMGKIIQTNATHYTKTSVDIGMVKKMISILDTSRASNYDDWIRLGWCLRNIDNSLLEDWDDFSQNSQKYQVGYCDKLWYHMRECGLGMGTLHMWAKKDNREEYEKLITADISSYINKSLSGTDYDIALVIERMFKIRFRCASHRHHLWYEFKNHRWHEVEKGYTLFSKEIPTKLFDEYTKVVIQLSSQSLGQDDEQQRHLENNVKELNKIKSKLKNTAFRDKMYKECSALFYEPGFSDKLDASPTLIGFENGVFDLETDEFREGRPEDFISFSTGINYIEYDKENPYIEEINEFMTKVLPNDNVRYYVWTLFASMLDGSNRDEKFHIWTGCGSNGKSKIVELFQNAIGEYGCIFNISLLTQKRVGSSATNSELAIAKGKRFAILQEPEEHEKLNVGLMKELTGGDKIQCRSLFKEPIKFKPMFKMILTCNHMPSIPPDDGGTWRRVRRVEFTSKFVDSPTQPNEFKIDRELNYKFELWKETFMAMLLKYYIEYKATGKIVEPKEVTEYTNEYQKKNDIFADFCEGYIKEDEFSSVPLQKVFAKFNEYCTMDNIKTKGINKNVFKEAMVKRYGPLQKVKNVAIWKGIALIENNNDLSDSDDDI